MGQVKIKADEEYVHKLNASQKKTFPAGWTGWVDPSVAQGLVKAGKGKILEGDGADTDDASDQPVFKIASKKWGVRGLKETFETKKAATAAYQDLADDGDEDDEGAGDGQAGDPAGQSTDASAAGGAGQGDLLNDPASVAGD